MANDQSAKDSGPEGKSMWCGGVGGDQNFVGGAIMANHFAPQTESTELAFEAFSTRDTGHPWHIHLPC